MNLLSFFDLIVKFQRYHCSRIPEQFNLIINENQIYIICGNFMLLKFFLKYILGSSSGMPLLNVIEKV